MDAAGRGIHAGGAGALDERRWCFWGRHCPAATPKRCCRPPICRRSGRETSIAWCATAAPRAIGIIDGGFLDVASVWHREILWALSQGVHVFGAASMGALRAAELDGFGMRGVGRIYAAYRDGCWPGYDEAFEDDDEVAVIHAPPEAGGLPLSDAMVDLRDTLLAAEAAGIIDRPSRDALTARDEAPALR